MMGCMQAYRTSFSAALEAEHAEEWQAAQERLTSWPQQRLKVRLLIPLGRLTFYFVKVMPMRKQKATHTYDLVGVYC